MAKSPPLSTDRPAAPADRQRQQDLWFPITISLVALSAGAVVILSKTSINRSVALACALGFLCVGILIGFLFGIPKVVQGQGEATVTAPPEGEGNGGGNGGGKAREDRGVVYRMQVNTNLEQISDWLSKIIVGVGLVELKQIPDGLKALSEYIQPGLGGGADAKVMALAIILYSSLVGFFVGYLVTRTYIAGVFRRADQQNLVAEVEVGGVAVSLDEAERLKMTIIEDLQEHVARLENRLTGQPPEVPEPPLERAPEVETSPLRSRGVVATPVAQLPRRVLWVDDEPENNRYHVAFLRKRGVEVVTATSTREAVEQLRREAFDVVISDSTRKEGGRMNRTAGIELAQALRELEPGLPLYIYTRPETAPAITERAQSAGATAVFSSPTDLLRALQLTPPEPVRG